MREETRAPACADIASRHAREWPAAEVGAPPVWCPVTHLVEDDRAVSSTDAAPAEPVRTKHG